MLDKLEIICREINEVEADLQEFLEDYYSRVGHLLLHHRQEASAASPCPAPATTPEAVATPRSALQTLSRQFYVELVRRHHPDHHAHPASRSRTQRVIETYQSGNAALLWKEYFLELCSDLDSGKLSDKSVLFDFYHNTQMLLLQQRQRLNTLESSEENQLRLRVFTARLEGVDLIQSILRELCGNTASPRAPVRKREPASGLPARLPSVESAA